MTRRGPVRLALWISVAAVIGLIVARPPAAHADSAVTLSSSSAPPGSKVVVALAGWEVGLVTVGLCGNEAHRGSVDCDLRNAQTVVPSGQSNPELVELTVAAPPAPCPCVVRVATSVSDTVRTVPIAVEGVPDAPVVVPDPLQTSLRVTARVRHVGTSALRRFRSLLGGPANRVLALTIENTGPQPISDVDLSAAVGRSLQDGAPLPLPHIEPLRPHESRDYSVPLALPAPSFGTYVVFGTVYGPGRPVQFEARTATTPWLLMLFGLAAPGAMAVRYARRKRSRGAAARQRVSAGGRRPFVQGTGASSILAGQPVGPGPLPVGVPVAPEDVPSKRARPPAAPVKREWWRRFASTESPGPVPPAWSNTIPTAGAAMPATPSGVPGAPVGERDPWAAPVRVPVEDNVTLRSPGPESVAPLVPPAQSPPPQSPPAQSPPPQSPPAQSPPAQSPPAQSPPPTWDPPPPWGPPAMPDEALVSTMPVPVVESAPPAWVSPPKRARRAGRLPAKPQLGSSGPRVFESTKALVASVAAVVMLSVVAIVAALPSGGTSAVGPAEATRTTSSPAGSDGGQAATADERTGTTATTVATAGGQGGEGVASAAPAIPADITVEGNKGLKDGDVVTVSVKSKPGSEIFGFEAFLCASGPTFELDADIRSDLTGNCASKPLSAGSDRYKEAKSMPPYEVVETTFRAGVGTDSFTLTDGTPVTITCGPGHNCQLALKVQYRDGYGFRPYPLEYA